MSMRQVSRYRHSTRCIQRSYPPSAWAALGLALLLYSAAGWSENNPVREVVPAMGISFQAPAGFEVERAKKAVILRQPSSELPRILLRGGGALPDDAISGAQAALAVAESQLVYLEVSEPQLIRAFEEHILGQTAFSSEWSAHLGANLVLATVTLVRMSDTNLMVGVVGGVSQASEQERIRSQFLQSIEVVVEDSNSGADTWLWIGAIVLVLAGGGVLYLGYRIALQGPSPYEPDRSPIKEMDPKTRFYVRRKPE